MDTRLNIALVGFGKFGKKYYRNILKDKKFYLKKIYRKKKYKSKIFQKLSNENININKIKAAIVVTPVESHYKISSFFIKNKIPIILEKPAAKYPKEIKKLSEISKKKRSTVIVNYSDLFNENFNFLISKKKIIGKIKYIKIDFGKFSSHYKKKTLTPAEDWLSHPFAIVLALFKKITNIDVISNKIVKKNQSFFQDVHIKFRTFQKINGEIIFSNSRKIKKRNLILYGEKGFLNYDGYNKKNNFIMTNKRIVPKKKYPSPMEKILETLYFYSKKKKFFSNLDLSLEVGKILHRIRKKF